MATFAQDVSTENITKEVKRLLDHSKDIRELDLYLRELRRRKLRFKRRIIMEMTEPLATITKELRGGR